MIDKTVKIELNEVEAEQFKAFRKFQSVYEQMPAAWREVIDYTAGLGSGTYQLTFQNGLPVKIEQPVKKIIIGLLAK